MRYIDVTGKTESEAIEKALSQLGLERDDVSVEILERAKSGFLGIGSSPAKVRVTYDAGEEEPVAVAAPAQEASPARETAPVRETASVRETAPVRETASVREKNPVKEAGAAREKTPAREKKPKSQPKEPKAPVVPVDLGEEADDEKAQQIRTFLTGLLQHMDSEAQIKIYLAEKDRYKVYLEGEKMGQLIGRRGETLDAIQQLTNYSVNRGKDRRSGSMWMRRTTGRSGNRAWSTWL